MLVGQPPFSIVFPNFLTWIEQCVEEACCGNNDMYCPGIRICIHRIYSYVVYPYSVATPLYCSFAFILHSAGRSQWV